MSYDTSRIDVAVACGTNSEGYAEFLVWSINETARQPERFRYILGVNNDGVDVDRLHALEDIADVVVVDARSGLDYCSKSHGMTLDKVYALVESDVSMVCDVDVAFLEPGWDEMYLSKLRDGCVAVGPEYSRIYHLVGGHHKHLGFPNLLATMLDTRLMRERAVSFMPDHDVTTTEEDAWLYGVPVGTIVRRDTGWQLSPRLREGGNTGYAMRMLSYGDAESQLLVGEQRLNGNEFHMDGVPVLTHMGRSSIRRMGVHPAALLWEERVRMWIDDRRSRHRLVNQGA